jgi:hypothetical protein
MTNEELKQIAENEIIMGAHSEGGVDVEDIMSGRELSQEDADQVMALINSATVSITWDNERSTTVKSTKSVQSTVPVADIPSIIEDPARGIVSLVGDHGGLSLITGPSHHSGLVMGTLSIETEHGVVYLDPDETTEISEAFPLSEDHPWVVSWTIDSNASSPEEAAAKIWRNVFGRDFAGTDDACTFTVTDVESGDSVEIDLSENSSVSIQD